MTEKQRRRKNLKRQQRAIQNEGFIDKKTIAGVNDYTPYNALTGNDIMSRGRVTNPGQKLPGGFNTVKK